MAQVKRMRFLDRQVFVSDGFENSSCNGDGIITRNPNHSYRACA
jgi:hypothetical protein